MRRENASVQGLARQLGCSWKTLWRAIRPVLEAAAADESRFAGVTCLGVDEHVWHHVSTKPVDQGGRGPKEFTGMVDLTRDKDGHLRARLLDLVPGRSGEAYKTGLGDRGDAFRKRVQVATLDPFHGYKNAIDDQLAEAVAVLDAFHIVKLGTAALDEVRRRVQQDIHGHRGRKHDPLYRIRNILRAGQEHLTDRQRARLEAAFAAEYDNPIWPHFDALIWPHPRGVGWCSPGCLSMGVAPGGRGLGGGRGSLPGCGGAEPVGVGAGVDDVGVECEPVHDGGGFGGLAAASAREPWRCSLSWAGRLR